MLSNTDRMQLKKMVIASLWNLTR